MVRLTLLATTIVALVLYSSPAHACSCVEPPPPLAALAQATAVFEARVSRMETDTARLRTTAHLIVIRQWKGNLPEDVTVTTASQGSLCGFTFTPDTRYLLYAEGTGPNALSVSLCSRSRPMEQAGEDLAALLDVETTGPRGAAPAGGSSGGGSSAPPPRGPSTSATPPGSGGCGGCGGASLGLVGLVLVGGSHRRRG
jgi:hypothetical protein